MDFAVVERFFESNDLGVLSTIGNQGAPQSAVVGLTFLKDTREFVVGTAITSRKYYNVVARPEVSAVVWQGSRTVQIEGTARVLGEADAGYDTYRQKVIAKLPAKVQYKHDGLIVITPSWFRWTDTSVTPWQVKEF